MGLEMENTGIGDRERGSHSDIQKRDTVGGKKHIFVPFVARSIEMVSPFTVMWWIFMWSAVRRAVVSCIWTERLLLSENTTGEKCCAHRHTNKNRSCFCCSERREIQVTMIESVRVDEWRQSTKVFYHCCGAPHITQPLHSCHGDAHSHDCGQNGPLQDAGASRIRGEVKICNLVFTFTEHDIHLFKPLMFSLLIKHSFSLTCCYVAGALRGHLGNSSSLKSVIWLRWRDSDRTFWLVSGRREGGNGRWKGNREGVWHCFVMRRCVMCGKGGGLLQEK